MNPRRFSSSGALVAPLLFVLLVSCASQPQSDTAKLATAEHGSTPSAITERTNRHESKPDRTADEPARKDSGGKTVKAVLPEDVLSEKDLEKPPPKYEDWYKEGSDTERVETSDTTAGAIPAVKPFNFGRDPGGPDDKTLYLTVPKLGLEDVTAYNSVSEEKLKKSTVHIPATGFPWQKGANVFIAGHRIGFEGTPSYYVFFRLDELDEGDEIRLTNSIGREFLYRVTKTTVVGPNDVEVMEPEEGKSIVSLQTCTLPDYKQRLIVQGELVDESA